MEDALKKNIPPSSLQEVMIRTLESDLLALGKSGGIISAGETVSFPKAKEEAPRAGLQYPSAVSQFPHGEIYGAQVEANVARKIAASEGSNKPLHPAVWWVVSGVGVALILFLMGFFAPKLFKKEELPTGIIPPTPPPTQSSPPSVIVPPSPTESSSSFFRNVATLTAILPSDGSLTAAIGDASASVTSTPFFARVMLVRNGAELSLEGLLSATKIGLDEALYQANLEDEYAAFVYKDAQGTWPGVAFRLRAGKLPVVLQPQFAKIEQSITLKNFFVADPGVPSAEWRSERVGSELARTQSFAKPGATFSYGWFHNSYFIFSASLEGLREVVKRL